MLLTKANRRGKPLPVKGVPFTLRETRRDLSILKPLKAEYVNTLTLQDLTDCVGKDTAEIARVFIDYCAKLSFVGLVLTCAAKDVGYTLDRMKMFWDEVVGPYVVFPHITDEGKCVLIIDKTRLRLVRTLQLSLIPGTVPVYPIFVQLFSRVPAKGYNTFQYHVDDCMWHEVFNEPDLMEPHEFDGVSSELNDSNLVVKKEKDLEPLEVVHLPIIDENSHAWMLYCLCFRMAKYVSNKLVSFIIQSLPRPNNPGFRILENIGGLLELFASSAWEMHVGVKKSFTEPNSRDGSLYRILETFLLQRSGLPTKLLKQRGPRLYATKEAMECIACYCESNVLMDIEFKILLDIIGTSLTRHKDLAQNSVPLIGENKCYSAEESTGDIEPPAYYWYEFCFSDKVNLKRKTRMKLIRGISLESSGIPPTKFHRYMASKRCKAQHLRNYYKLLWKDLPKTHHCYTDMAPCPGRSAQSIQNFSEFLRMAEFASTAGFKKIKNIGDLSGDCNIDPYILTPCDHNYGNLPAVGVSIKNNRDKRHSPTEKELEREMIRFEDFLIVFSHPVVYGVNVSGVPKWVLQEAFAQHSSAYYDAIYEWLNDTKEKEKEKEIDDNDESVSSSDIINDLFEFLNDDNDDNNNNEEDDERNTKKRALVRGDGDEEDTRNTKKRSATRKQIQVV